MEDPLGIRLIDGQAAEEDRSLDSLRPTSLDEFVGQEEAKANLRVFITAARQRGEALDHVLLHGHPGLGKTTLAHIIARELDVGITATSGPVLERAGDLAAILTNLGPRDVLFVDEIHRLNHVVEEVLYPAMEDFHLDIVVGQGPGARTVKLNLEPFTLVGATTRAGLLTPPLRDRFGVQVRVDMYSPEDLALIVTRSAKLLQLELTANGAMEVARRSRATPRVANRLLKRGARLCPGRGQRQGRPRTVRLCPDAPGRGSKRPGPAGPRPPLDHCKQVRRRTGGSVQSGRLGERRGPDHRGGL